MVQPDTFISTPLSSNFGALGHLWSQESKWCDYVMVEADSHIKLLSTSKFRHIKSVWAHCYAVYCHRVAALHSYNPPTWLRFWGSGLLVESKRCDYVMVEANIYKMIERIDMLSMAIHYQPYTIISTHLWSQNNVTMSWLKLTATLNCFPHPYKTFAKSLSSSLTQLYPPYLAQILGFWVTCGVKMMSLCHGWDWQPHLKLLPASILDI